MKNRTKRITALGMAVLIGVMAMGCGAGDSAATQENNLMADSSLLSQSDPVELNFYSYSLAAASTASTIQELVDTFNSTIGQEKGIKVNAIADTDSSKHQTDIQAGNQVDIIQKGFGSLEESKRNLGINAYEDIFPAEEMQESFDGIEPAALELGKLEGKTYGVSCTLSQPILYVNATLFREAGLDPEEPLETWDDVLEAAKTIKEKTGYPGLGFTTNEGWDMEAAQSLILTNGGEVLNEDKTEVNFASEEGIEAISKWKEFYTEGVTAKGSQQEVLQQFATGKVGMNFMSSAALSTYLGASKQMGWELTGFKEPGFEGKEAVTVSAGSCLLVRSDSAKKSAAIWEFIKYMTSNEAYTAITSGMGYVPLRADLIEDENYLKQYAEENPLVAMTVEEMKNMKSCAIWPAGTGTEASSIFTDAITKAVTTDADVKETLEQAQEDINTILKQQ